MAKTIKDYLKGNIGDVVSLSDFQTQAQYDKLSVDFTIKEIRKYQEENGVFRLTVYVLSGPNEETPYIVMIKEVGTTYDAFLYYLNTAGDMYEAPSGTEVCPYYALLTPDLRDLVDRIEVTVHYKDKDLDVTWDKQGASNTVKYSDSTGLEGLATVADYYTNNDNNGNNRCFVDWKGDSKQGTIELWYGCLLKDHEIEIYNITNR